MTAETDGLGQTTVYTYDVAGRLTAQADPLGHTTNFYYDDEGRQTAVQDARGYYFTYQYDAIGQLTAQVNPLLHTISYGYYDDGLLQWRLDAGGSQTNYSYDAAHRRTLIQYPDQTRATYEYDPGGRLTLMSDWIGDTAYAYGPTNLLTQIGYPGPWTISYDYDILGQRATMTYETGTDLLTTHTTTYSYDGRGLLEALHVKRVRGGNVAEEGETTWAYDAGGLPTQMTHANNTSVHYDYDGAGRVVRVRHLPPSGGEAISSFDYVFDAGGSPVSVLEGSGDQVFWGYDAAGQLIHEQRTGSYAYNVAYSYDAAGNRASKVEGTVTTTYDYDAAGQLTVRNTNGTRATYTYDENGNTTEENDAGSRTTYTWDCENRLTQVLLPGGGRTTTSYYGDGKRADYEDGGDPPYRRFIWDGENVLFQPKARPGVSRLTNRHYVYHPQGYGELVSQVYVDDPDTGVMASVYHHYDGFGSTDRLTDPNGNWVSRYLQRAFGDASQEVLGEGVSSSPGNRYRWLGSIGYYWQPDTSDYWVRARVYNPGNGRWLSTDPEPSDPGLYLYAGNRPLNQVDPSGMILWPDIIPAPVRLAIAARGEESAPESGLTDVHSRPAIRRCLQALSAINTMLRMGIRVIGPRIYWSADARRYGGGDATAVCKRRPHHHPDVPWIVMGPFSGYGQVGQAPKGVTDWAAMCCILAHELIHAAEISAGIEDWNSDEGDYRAEHFGGAPCRRALYGFVGRRDKAEKAPFRRPEHRKKRPRKRGGD